MKPDVVVYNVMIHVHVFIFGISLFRNQYRMSSGSEIERNLFKSKRYVYVLYSVSGMYGGRVVIDTLWLHRQNRSVQ